MNIEFYSGWLAGFQNPPFKYTKSSLCTNIECYNMKYIGTKGEVCQQLKIFNPPVVYATDRSKAVVPVLFLILCSFVVYTTGRLTF